jgi:hypothetical protein
MTLSPEALVAGFESANLPDGAFRHPEHIEVTWLYLHRYPAAEAFSRVTGGLRGLARAHGHPERYHETLTCAFFFLVHQRMAHPGERENRDSWDAFRQANEDLFAWPSPLLGRYYQPETLGSELARRVFVLPDRGLNLSSESAVGPQPRQAWAEEAS